MWWLIAACAQPEPNAQSFAVLELFTSESCSDCPPADEQLGQRIADQRASGSRVFAAAWHVDYWNGLGWADPLSTADATARQSAYAQQHHSRTYTPQLVVNGEDESVGKTPSVVDEQVASWLQQPSPVSMTVTPGEVGDGALPVDLAVRGAPNGTELWLLLLQGHVTMDIPSGENAGKTLMHDNVVRGFVTVDPSATSATLPVPADYTAEDGSVLALVQDAGSLRIVGAELSPL